MKRETVLHRGWVGAANPMGRVGFGLQWSRVRGLRGVSQGAEGASELRKYMAFITMLHHVTEFIT